MVVIIIGLRSFRPGKTVVLWCFQAHCAPDNPSALCLSWRRERTEGGQSPPPSGAKVAFYPRLLPGGATLARAYRSHAGVDTVIGLRLFKGFSRTRRVAPSPGYQIAKRCSSATGGGRAPVVSASVVKKLTAGRTDRRSDKALAAIRQNNGTAVARVRRYAATREKCLVH